MKSYPEAKIELNRDLLVELRNVSHTRMLMNKILEDERKNIGVQVFICFCSCVLLLLFCCLSCFWKPIITIRSKNFSEMAAMIWILISKMCIIKCPTDECANVVVVTIKFVEIPTFCSQHQRGKLDMDLKYALLF